MTKRDRALEQACDWLDGTICECGHPQNAHALREDDKFGDCETCKRCTGFDPVTFFVQRAAVSQKAVKT